MLCPSFFIINLALRSWADHGLPLRRGWGDLFNILFKPKYYSVGAERALPFFLHDKPCAAFLGRPRSAPTVLCFFSVKIQVFVQAEEQSFDLAHQIAPDQLVHTFAAGFDHSYHNELLPRCFARIDLRHSRIVSYEPPRDVPGV